MLVRWLPRLLFAAMALAALIYTPLSVGFSLRSTFECEIQSSLDLWVYSLTNIRHIATYGILTATAVWAFGIERLWLAVVVSLLVTAGVELSQAIFAEGHCRLRDALPNLVAVALAVAVALGVAWALRPFRRV